jgi:uncharacterized protein YceK
MNSRHSPQGKKVLTLLIAFTVLLAGCGSGKPLTEAEQAANYGMTVERYREEKSAAARMGMSFEDHVQMIRSQ